jgi:hypothetical protein
VLLVDDRQGFLVGLGMGLLRGSCSGGLGILRASLGEGLRRFFSVLRRFWVSGFCS